MKKKVLGSSTIMMFVALVLFVSSAFAASAIYVPYKFDTTMTKKDVITSETLQVGADYIELNIESAYYERNKDMGTNITFEIWKKGGIFSRDSRVKSYNLNTIITSSDKIRQILCENY
ncbi:hypothetical protein [Paenibacillus thiaminolyticus]|uniref:DUF3888 domain-containing protein n=1 Tax=Paenibacillus thiaminolyticus TaxID=49283 RepID=A0A3A3GYQ5_PANTH|nr:hypothetical protein [Paenibacillus thiaminolyticus]RJG23357.1 hypothetical protein DQX05_14020 [Paenibacillus thiaminolyticus]